MSEYKVEDKVLARAKITCINIDYMHPIEVEFENGSRVWLEEKDLMLDMTNVETIPQEEVMKSAYNQGLNDAWELARKIFDEMGTHERDEVFGYGYETDILKCLTPQEALAKLKAYEEAQEEIEIGDIVVHLGTKGVVLDFIDSTDDEMVVLNQNGCVEEWKHSQFKKTGKHIDIQSILEQIGGE